MGSQISGPSPTHNWPAMREAYVEGIPAASAREPRSWPTLNEVADRFGVSATYVRERAARDRWTRQREAFQRQVDAERSAARARMLADAQVSLERDVVAATRMAVSLVSARLGEIGAAQQARARGRSAADAVEGVSDPVISAPEVRSLVDALDTAHRMGLRATGGAESTSRVEVTGAGGGAVAIEAELARDNPSRAAGVLAVLAQAGVGELIAGPGDDGGDVVDAEVVGGDGDGGDGGDGDGEAAPAGHVGGAGGGDVDVVSSGFERRTRSQVR